MSANPPPSINPPTSIFNSLEFQSSGYLPLSGGNMTGNIKMGTNSIIGTGNLGGTITTVSQPDITSLGTISSLTATVAGIGTNPTTYPLTLGNTTQTINSTYTYVASNNSTPGTGSNTGAQSFSLYTTGRIACALEIDIFSDKKIKENIRNITKKEVNLFIKIKPKYYNKIGNNNYELGYISQDIAKTKLNGIVNLIPSEGQPEYIDEHGIISPKDHILTINYQKIVCLLHAKIQLMDKNIKKLENKIRNL